MEDEDAKDEVDSKVVKRTRFRRAVLTVLNRINSTNYPPVFKDQDVPDQIKNQQPSAASTPAPMGYQDRVEKLIQHPGVSALKKTHVRNVAQNLSDTPLSHTRSRHFRTAVLKRSSNIELDTSQETTSYIKIVIWTCICVQVFVHPSLLHLLPVPIIYTILKKGWKWFIESKVQELLSSQYFSFRDFWNKRCEAIFPHPVSWVAVELYKIERDLLKSLPNFLDTIVTCLMIIGMIVGVVLTLIFVSAQMYTETLYIVQTSGKVVTSVTNSTLFQHMNESWGVQHHTYFKGKFLCSSSFTIVLKYGSRKKIVNWTNT